MGILSRKDRMNQIREACMPMTSCGHYCGIAKQQPGVFPSLFVAKHLLQIWENSYPMQYRGKNSGLELRRPIIPASNTPCDLELGVSPDCAWVWHLQNGNRDPFHRVFLRVKWENIRERLTPKCQILFDKRINHSKLKKVFLLPPMGTVMTYSGTSKPSRG